MAEPTRSERPRRPRRPWTPAARRFLANRLAVGGLAVLLLVVAGALVGGAFGHLFAFPAPELAGGATTQWTFKRDELNKDPNAFMYVSRLRS